MYLYMCMYVCVCVDERMHAVPPMPTHLELNLCHNNAQNRRVFVESARCLAEIYLYVFMCVFVYVYVCVCVCV